MNLVFLILRREFYYHLAHEIRKGVPTIAIAWQVEKTSPNLPEWLEESARLADTAGSQKAIGIKGLMLAHLASLKTAMEGEQAAVIPEPSKVVQARHWILQMLADPQLSVALLAKRLQCNADYLSQVFREATGTSLKRWITLRRIERAEVLLDTSTLNIAEIGTAVGYRDANYFTRAFRQATGMTPGEYRKIREG